MKKVMIIVGHGLKDSGAINEHTKDTEFLYNTDLKNKLVELLKGRYEVVTYNRGYLKIENIPLLNNLKPDLIISLHCNSFNTIASGTEVLYWNKSKKGKIIADILSDNISTVLSLPNRHSVSIVRGERGSGLLERTNAPCVIVEPFFIDNDKDLQKGKTLKNEYAQSIVKSIDKYFEIIK